MSTNLGKLLVLLNAFASVGVLSWAVAANLNRQDPEQAVDAAGEKLTDKLKRLNADLVSAQGAFAPALAAVSDGEAKQADYANKIKTRLEQSEKGEFYDIFSPAAPQAADPNDPKAFARTRRLVWGPQAPKILGADKKTPLRGVDALLNDLDAVRKAIVADTAAITARVDDLGKLNDEVDVLNARIRRQRDILKAHLDETAALTDERVNWDDRLAAVRKRNGQLCNRIESVTGKKVCDTVPTSVVAPVALTPDPRR